MDADVTLDTNLLTLHGDRVTVGKAPNRRPGGVVFPADVTSAQFAASAGARGVRLDLGRQTVTRASVLGRLAGTFTVQPAFRVHLPSQFDHPIKAPDIQLQSTGGFQSLVQRLLALEAQLEAVTTRVAQLEAASHAHPGGGGGGGGGGNGGGGGGGG